MPDTDTIDPPAAAPAAVESPATDTPAAAAPAPEPAREPTVLERVAATFQSKSAILARAGVAETALAEARESLATQAAQIAGLEAKVTALTAERDAAQGQLQQLDALLKTAESEKQTAEERALDLVAERGFSAANLPAAEAEPEETVESLTAKMNAERDPKVRWDLSRRISALRWESAPGAN